MKIHGLGERQIPVIATKVLVVASVGFLFGAMASVIHAQLTVIEPGAYYDIKYATTTLTYEQQEQTELINVNFRTLHDDNLNIIRILNDIKYSRQ